ncbi:MAG: polysaccharide deacetylase family protein [Candidatus Latescibacteria bacterium]|nr:polysaccharide deacetylase family protein [Candidatus Latescibacterota bacterium]
MIKKILESIEHIPPDFLKKKLDNVLWEGTPESKALALTFDDGPDPDITPMVLETLETIGARGTFFMVGEKVAKYPDIARMVADSGHLIGNHSMTHNKMFLTRKKEVERELEESQTIIRDTIGMKPRWFRPPYGMFDFTVADVVKRKGMSIVLWTVLSGDYSEYPPDKILEIVKPFMRPGAIMVFHDTLAGGGSALPGIITELHNRISDNGIGLDTIEALSFSGFREVEEPDD